MSVQKQRHTSSRGKRRRSHHGLKKQNLQPCSHCGTLINPHKVCPNCGYYRGRQVIDVLKKLDKKDKKTKEKELAEQEKEAQTNKSLNLENLSKKK
jgi:large subunit ribosomal protein L32